MHLRLDDRLGQLRPDTLTAAAIVAAFALAAALAGYVIASGQTVPIALVLGTIAGIALLNALPLVIWIILAGALLISGPVVMFAPGLEKVGWLFSLLGFFLTGAAILYPAVGRERFSRPMPSFVAMAVILFVFGLVSLLYSDGPLSEGVRAGKRYFQFFGLLFVLSVIPFQPSIIKRWWIFLTALAVLQLPFALFQRFKLVPLREGMPQVYPLDIVVGTMEGSITGGGSSSVMALLLIFMLAFVLAAHRDNVLGMRKLVPLMLSMSIPLAIGEVTLIAVLLPVALGAVYFDLVRRRPFQLVLGMLFLLPVVAAAWWTYIKLNVDPGQSLSRMIENVIAYNFGQTGYFGGVSLNRTSIYTYWVQHHGLSDLVSMLFGHGLGSSFGPMGEPNPGHMDVAHARMYIGLTAASSLLWDLGVLGFLLFWAIFLSAIYYAWLLTQVAQPGFDRAFCRSLFAMALMLAVMPFYSDSLITVPSQEVLTALSLGLIAWRWRIHAVHARTRESRVT